MEKSAGDSDLCYASGGAPSNPPWPVGRPSVDSISRRELKDMNPTSLRNLNTDWSRTMKKNLWALFCRNYMSVPLPTKGIRENTGRMRVTVLKVKIISCLLAPSTKNQLKFTARRLIIITLCLRPLRGIVVQRRPLSPHLFYLPEGAEMVFNRFVSE